MIMIACIYVLLTVQVKKILYAGPVHPVHAHGWGFIVPYYRVLLSVTLMATSWIAFPST